MSGRRRGGSGRGWKHSSVAALATLGCCLLSAPVADADFEDLFDVVLGAASAGPDLSDLGAVPADLGGFDVHDFLQDPLAQLDQAFHDSPGQLGLGEPEPGPADTGHEPGTAPDTTPDQGSATTPDQGSGTGSEHGHGESSGNSGNSSPSLPKFSMPSGGNGGGGNGGSGGGPGGSGGSGNGATKAKANASATKDTLLPTPAPQPALP